MQKGNIYKASTGIYFNNEDLCKAYEKTFEKGREEVSHYLKTRIGLKKGRLFPELREIIRTKINKDNIEIFIEDLHKIIENLEDNIIREEDGNIFPICDESNSFESHSEYLKLKKESITLNKYIDPNQ